MPKRSYYDEKINKYQRKIRKLESKKPRRHIVYSTESESDSEPDKTEYEEENRDVSVLPENETPADEHVELPLNISLNEISSNNKQDDTPKTDDLPTLDPDILSALGEATEETPKFGPKIHENLARLWTPILRKGLNKELKDKLLKQYLVPENCPMLQAPKLNPEISAAISDSTRARDRRVEAVQQQLGLGITALNRALALLVENDDKKLDAIKLLSDSCRILCDLHHEETQARVKFVTPGLDKSFLNVVQDVDRDDMLFGNKLSDKIKASKVIEKQGLQIKKPPPPKPVASSSHSSMNRPRPQQGNWSGPPRFPSNRGGRGGLRKTVPAGTSSRRAPTSNQTKPSHQNKSHRAPTQ